MMSVREGARCAAAPSAFEAIHYARLTVMANRHSISMTPEGLTVPSITTPPPIIPVSVTEAIVIAVFAPVAITKMHSHAAGAYPNAYLRARLRTENKHRSSC